MINKIIKIAMIQDQPGSGIKPDYSNVISEFKPDFLALPEYYFVGQKYKNVVDSSNRRSNFIHEIIEISKKFDTNLIGGTIVVEENGVFRNRSYVYSRGDLVGHYDKIHPYGREGRSLISPGSEYKVFEINGLRIGFLVCADVLYPDSFRNIRGLKPDIIFVPTTSPYRKNESKQKKFQRDYDLFARGAMLSNSVIFKVCASGKITGHRLQGRSLIAFPSEIVWRVEPENEDKSALILIEYCPDPHNHHLDIKALHI